MIFQKIKYYLDLLTKLLTFTWEQHCDDFKHPVFAIPILFSYLIVLMILIISLVSEKPIHKFGLLFIYISSISVIHAIIVGIYQLIKVIVENFNDTLNDFKKEFKNEKIF